jgi:hypothetical protein
MIDWYRKNWKWCLIWELPLVMMVVIWLCQWPLITFLTTYFPVMFVLSTWRRMHQYGEMGKLVVTGTSRWPKLLKLVRDHRTIFLTWKTVAPLGLLLALSILQFVAQGTWDSAKLSPDELLREWYMLPIVLPLAYGMLAVDVYFLIEVGTIDRPMLDKYFDQAEYWLASRTAHVVKWVTLGKINPRLMVATEVRKALIEASDMLNSNFWWVCLQTGLRVSFGLSLWIAWRIGG